MNLNTEQQQKLQAIKLIIFDIDGVMTDGGIYFTEQGETMKRFNANDGIGLKLIQHMGYEIVIISGRQSACLERRLLDLGIQNHFLGKSIKVESYFSCLEAFKIMPEQVAYMGDDINDLPVLEKVGFAACPNNAVSDVKAAVDWVSQANGGHGAVREFCELLLKTTNQWQEAIKLFGNE